MGNTAHTEDRDPRRWIEQLREHYDRAVQRFEDGQRGTANVISREAEVFLDSIGASAGELYDFVEDWVEYGEPDFDTVAAVTGVRRDYFLTVQRGRPSGGASTPAALPSGHAELGGYRWLPRIIAKARAKLRGEMPPDVMFGCGADRPFLRSVNMAPAEFLNTVWRAGEDDHVILDAMRRKAAPPSGQ